MIGVRVRPDNLAATNELFELFKTAWEPAAVGRRYTAVITDGSDETDGVGLDAPLVVAYAARELDLDRGAGVAVRGAAGPVMIDWAKASFPVYGTVALFATEPRGEIARCRGQAVEYRVATAHRTVVRVGIDLFAEVAHLLGAGQSREHALTPTLDWHIAHLRALLLENGVPLVEVPPRPFGHEFVCCLTHDIDFFGIRRHRWDRTLLGFLYRASIGTAVAALRGRRSRSDVRRNFGALIRLPIVALGVARDFWHPIDDYAAAEPPRRSTFFVVPFKGIPGVGPSGAVEASRAVKYGAADVGDELQAAVRRGSEIALHGIDAWRDPERGRAEADAVGAAAGTPASGVRMHWLYFDAESPRTLESAGFSFDSTCGYNDAVGFRAGTSQVFKPLAVNRLLELPLSIMDTALLFAGRMHLTQDAALALCDRIVAHARRAGGTVVVNWHDRSLAPERLWDTCYRRLLDAIACGATPWYATASQAVDWFRWRRSIRFTVAEGDEVALAAAPRPAGVPPAVVMRYQQTRGTASVQEQRFDGSVVDAAARQFAC
jgi:hypothetical protein